MDTVSKEKRSEVMSKIRGKNTSIEMRIRKLLFANGYRFRLHKKAIHGSPDIYLGKYKTAVFINGCFWHRHASCKAATTPKSNVEFWNNKFNRNMNRDMEIYKDLNAQGIKVIIIWECTVNKLKHEENKNQFLIEFKHALDSESLLIEI